MEVIRFLTAILAGDFKLLMHLVGTLKHLHYIAKNESRVSSRFSILISFLNLAIKQDISNREGLACEADWYHRCYSSR
jgi:F-box/leucine-rich repeat protein 2/20